MLLNLSEMPASRWPQKKLEEAKLYWGSVVEKDALSFAVETLNQADAASELFDRAMTEVLTLLGYSIERSAVLFPVSNDNSTFMQLREWLVDAGVTCLELSELEKSNENHIEEFEIEDATGDSQKNASF